MQKCRCQSFSSHCTRVHPNVAKGQKNYNTNYVERMLHYSTLGQVIGFHYTLSVEVCTSTSLPIDDTFEEKNTQTLKTALKYLPMSWISHGPMSMMSVAKLNVCMLMRRTFILSNDISNIIGSHAPCDQFDMCPCGDCT